MASPTESGLAVWITRLPGFQLRSDQADGDGVDSSPVSDSPLFPRPNLAVFDHPGPHSFVRLDEFPAVLCRDMTAVARASRGQVMARVLSANPAEPWPQPPWRRRTTGARISLLVSGSVWFYLAGTGEESFSAKDSWYLPPGFDYALLEASSDFELLEIELPASAGSQVGGLTIPEVLMLYATYSYRSVRCFGGLDDEAHASAEAGDPDAGPSLKLDDGAPTRWAGCPWHLREQGLQCGYLTRGTARIEVDGAGVVDAQPGTFWLQQAQIAPRLLRTPQHDKDAKSQRSTGTGSAGAAVSDYW